MLSAAVVAGLVGVVQNLRLLRLDGRMESGAQLAIWDRLMRLPARFFTGRSSGEIANSMLGISFVGEALSALLPQLVGGRDRRGDPRHAPGGRARARVGRAGIVAVTMLTFGAFAVLIVRQQRSALPAEHRAAAMTNQLLGGIAKIKLAAAEDRAHARWSEVAATARAALQPGPADVRRAWSPVAHRAAGRRPTGPVRRADGAARRPGRARRASSSSTSGSRCCSARCWCWCRPGSR